MVVLGPEPRQGFPKSAAFTKGEILGAPLRGAGPQDTAPPLRVSRMGLCFARRSVDAGQNTGHFPRMSTKVLEQTVTDLQRRVSELENKVESMPQTRWQKVVGAAKDDTHFNEAMKLGAAWRKKANREDW